MGELQQFSSLRRVWMPFGHVRIKYLKCYNHAFNLSDNETQYPYVGHSKTFVNYKKAFYCYINYKGEYFDRKIQRKCEILIGRACLKSTLLNIKRYIQHAISNNAEKRKCCDHQHCICFL